MQTRSEQTWIYWLVSPFVWASFSIVIFLVSFFFPPITYNQYIEDPCFGYYNWNSAQFTGLCLLAMLAGWWFFQKISSPVYYRKTLTPSNRSPVTMADLAVGLILLAANIGFLAMLFRSGALSQLQNIGKSQAETAAFYEELMNTLDANGLGSLMQISAIVIPWFYWLRVQSIQNGSGKGKLIASGLFWTVLVSYLFPLLILGRRNVILLPLFGVFLVWFLGQVKYGKVNPYKFAFSLIVLGASAFSLFFIVELIRFGFLSGERGMNEMATRIIGYLVAPYNLQGAMIDGALEFPGAGKGYYWTSWIWKFPLLQHVFVAEDILGAIPPFGVQARCDVLAANGFKRHFTSLPIFANSFVDFGWLGTLPFLLYGFLGALTWKRFREGTVDGILLYTMFAYSVLEWRGNIMFPAPYMGIALVFLAILGIGRWSLNTSRYHYELLYQPYTR
ncbi:hypothetical protein Pla110_40120 [Polystyrenella longa]|uniref:Oligosaccharide repeat unit polymerase n=1 Tax=Polystyrenella longa TaxID=2528007 RepID=A0A518CSQ0_9PLAN|nr:hypothetical protein [Polystyrenella longa]QDU82257.1 hypothetical protein Pla110_40120 [Polystyrenella longa]